MFKKHDYVFVLSQDGIMNNDEEKELKKQVFKYAEKSINSIWTIFKRRKIVYFDYYSSSENTRVYSYMATCFPEKNIKFKPLLFEIFAFTITENVDIFKDYETEFKEFSNGNQKIKLYKIKI